MRADSADPNPIAAHRPEVVIAWRPARLEPSEGAARLRRLAQVLFGPSDRAEEPRR